ncbi:MAG TPA: SUMF1/EgtB/PvdO family nonheme iron enzyme [archaeon]|nr:SUMF1/EgtB/PvdO family nonheme iron enzyme [archaeon]
MRKLLLLLSLSLLITGSFAAISFSQVQPAVESTYRGDINGDGQVNILDMLEMLKMLSIPEGRTERELQIADVDASGAVDIFDLLGLLRVLSGEQEPGLIYWHPSIAGLSRTSVSSGDTLIISVENINETITAAEVKAFINAGEVSLLEFGPDSIKIIIPAGFTGGYLKLIVAADTTNSVYIVSSVAIHGIEMVSIPAGTFQMGSDSGNWSWGPVHTVSISAFQMSRYEVIQEQYEAVMDTNPSVFTGESNLPVNRVDWYEAVVFCNKLSEAAGLEPCYTYIQDSTYVLEGIWDLVLCKCNCDFTKNGFRLPTEAEWEYACRAGTTTKYYTGDSESDLSRAGWYKKNSHSRPHPVGQKEPNAFGLYDMHGNQTEWCTDYFDFYYYSRSPSQDPPGPSEPFIVNDFPLYVIRGGDWCWIPCESCARGACIPIGPTTYAVDEFARGFRVVRRYLQ